jgi:hypothetical protein
MSHGMESVVAICKAEEAECALAQEQIELTELLSDALRNGEEITMEPGLPAKEVADGLRDIAYAVEDTGGDRWSVKVRIIPSVKKHGGGAHPIGGSE